MTHEQQLCQKSGQNDILLSRNGSSANRAIMTYSDQMANGKTVRESFAYHKFHHPNSPETPALTGFGRFSFFLTYNRNRVWHDTCFILDRASNNTHKTNHKSADNRRNKK